MLAKYVSMIYLMTGFNLVSGRRRASWIVSVNWWDADNSGNDSTTFTRYASGQRKQEGGIIHNIALQPSK